MILTIRPLISADFAHILRWAPRVATWLLLAAIVVFLGWAYTSNQQPSPYGSCYAARGRPMPCELVKH